VALLERLDPLCLSGDTLVNPHLLGDAPGGGNRQQVSLAFMRQVQA
jgi:hypothetical protein